MLKKNKRHISNSNACLDKCKAICCHDLAVEILKPTTKLEKEELKWHLFFVGVKVYIRRRKWHLLIHSRCRYLSDANRCTIYHNRPSRCREHNHPHCELEGVFYDHLIETPEQFDEYFAKEKARLKKKNRK